MTFDLLRVRKPSVQRKIKMLLSVTSQCLASAKRSIKKIEKKIKKIEKKIEKIEKKIEKIEKKIGKSRRNKPIVFVFFLFWTLVWLISIVDVYWSIKLGSDLRSSELNPLGCWLIDLDNGSVALFMATKMCGTMFVLTVCPLLFWHNSKIGYAVQCALAAVMCGVFYYLHWG